MRQILITRSGKPRSLKIIESISKDPRHNEIKVAVKAIGLNFSDLLIRIGLYPDAPTINIKRIVSVMGCRHRRSEFPSWTSYYRKHNG